MGSLFANIYTYFSNRKFLFFSLLAAMVTILILGALRLKPQEDITRMLPEEPRLQQINQALQEVKFGDKILLSVSVEDPQDREKLLRSADALEEKLLNLKPTYIEELNYKLGEEQMQAYFDLFYTHLPLYLNEDDYAEIDSMLQGDNLAASLQSSYRLLLTPAGSFIQKTLVRDPLHMTPRALKRLKSLEGDENFVAVDQRLFSKDAKHVFMFISPRHKAKESGPNAKFLEELQKIEQAHEAEFETDIHYFGAPLVSAGNAIQIKKDVNRTMGLVAGVLFLFLLYFYRKPQYFLMIIVPVLFGGIFGLGILGFLQPEISAISLGVGAILLGITIDYSLHIFTHYQHAKSKSDLLKEVSLSLVMSCITTVLAFLCLLFTKSPVLHDLGAFAGLSIVGAALGSLLVLPHILPANTKSKHKENKLEKWLGTAFHDNKILVGMVLISTFLAVYFYKAPTFEKNMDNLNYMSESMLESEKFLDELGNVSNRNLFVIARRKNPDEALEKLESINPTLQKLVEQKRIHSVSGPGELMLSHAAQEKKIAEWNAFWDSEKKEKLKANLHKEAAKLGFKEHAFDPFYALLDKNFEPVGTEGLSALYAEGPLREFVQYNDSSASVFALIKVKPENRQAVIEQLENEKSIVVFDKKYLSDQIVDAVSSDFSLLANISLIMVFLVLLMAYGRFELAIIAFLPLGLSWFWVMGAMQLFDLKMNLINLIITTFVFGLGIDYSIFVLNGLIRDQRYGTSNLATYKSSIFLSAFTTIIGMGGMLFAGHPALRSIAIMSVVGIASVLILVYICIPLMYRFLVSGRIEKHKAPLTLKNIWGTLLAWLMILWGFHLLIFYALPLRILILIPLKTRKKSIHFLLYIWANCYIKMLFPFRKKAYGEIPSDMRKQRIYIANHQSFIDTVFMFSLSPYAIIATNNRIYNHFIFGPICRLCDFLNVSDGIEDVMQKIRLRWQEGYSFLIFPEGTRSEDQEIHRFHKGAFKLSEELQAPIMPVLIHGSGDFLPKGSFWGGFNDLVYTFLPEILPGDRQYGQGYSEQSKYIRKYMAEELENLRNAHDMPYYLRSKIMLNYIYINPVLYWYLYVKFKVEKRYSVFHNHLPKTGNIYDIGCGYGMMSYILHYAARGRKIMASDFDEEKIETAKHRFMRNAEIEFRTQRAQDVVPEKVSGVVFSDILHYLSKTDQEQVLQNFADHLLPGGVILIKDGDSSETGISGTKRSEYWSTKIMGFNKTGQEEMTYFDSRFLEEFCRRNALKLEELETSRITSNKVWKITHEI